MKKFDLRSGYVTVRAPSLVLLLLKSSHHNTCNGLHKFILFLGSFASTSLQVQMKWCGGPFYLALSLCFLSPYERSEASFLEPFASSESPFFHLHDGMISFSFSNIFPRTPRLLIHSTSMISHYHFGVLF
jgi:hypothetical protein